MNSQLRPSEKAGAASISLSLPVPRRSLHPPAAGSLFHSADLSCELGDYSKHQVRSWGGRLSCRFHLCVSPPPPPCEEGSAGKLGWPGVPQGWEWSRIESGHQAYRRRCTSGDSLQLQSRALLSGGICGGG